MTVDRVAGCCGARRERKREGYASRARSIPRIRAPANSRARLHSRSIRTSISLVRYLYRINAYSPHTQRAVLRYRGHRFRLSLRSLSYPPFSSLPPPLPLNSKLLVNHTYRSSVPFRHSSMQAFIPEIRVGEERFETQICFVFVERGRASTASELRNDDALTLYLGGDFAAVIYDRGSRTPSPLALHSGLLKFTSVRSWRLGR